MPNVFDVLLVLAFAVLLPMWSHFILWPRHERAVDTGDVRARSRESEPSPRSGRWLRRPSF